ncbi:ribbon-helix-helix protein, CopG family [Candidatus Microgenomates bacterium]|nr:ribbon-helix-helix protein, CopG family [Candidatus Microgenomates bacterium]
MPTQTFNIALPQELVKEVDKRAKIEYKNRSELIREALRVYLLKRN